MYFINMNPDDYVTDSFKVSTYKSIYALNILPVDGMNMWMKIRHVPCKPPLERRIPGIPLVNRKNDKSETKNQKHVARPPRSMTCKNYGETGHNKNGCEKPKVPGEQADIPNEQPNRASQQGNPPIQQANPPSQQINPPKKKGEPMVEDPVNARVPSQSRDNIMSTKCGIWIGGTSATGSNRGGRVLVFQTVEGEVLVVQTEEGEVLMVRTGEGRERASGSNKVLVKTPVVKKYILLDEDDLVDVQVEEEVVTRDENVATVADAYENVVAEAAEQDENQDEATRLKRNYEEFS
uniref:Putative reverse transcriptase domain-containing protein n=1 Tax=Tanacetum cinerariifolium TaxID=118510 RepID=A0A6L2MNG6_TANCI|nr:putative reverse transcriptase domain-containing protein [Tanacetum cinerariifolium]